MTFIGVVGSGEYKRKDIVIMILEKTIDKDITIIVSGKSPRNEYNNVDIWAEDWGRENCKNEPVIFPPEEFTKVAFFKRNKLIADVSSILLVFINLRQYQSGAWNTVKWFIQKPDFCLFNLFIYDENGNEWSYDLLPLMIKKMVK